MEMQQSGRLQNDGGAEDTCRAHEQGAQSGDNGTKSACPRESGQGDDQMNKEDSEVAHSGNGINTSRNHRP